MDFEHTKREQVLNYVAQKYGVENVCHIVTFGQMAAKMALRDVTRVLGYPYELGDRLSKMVPDIPKITLDEAIKENPDFAAAIQSEPDVKRVVDIARRLEGCKRHSSQHACFDGNTLVTTKTGKKTIRSIRPGEEVLTHERRYKPVMETQVTTHNEIHRLVFANGSVLKVTANHPLLLATPQKHPHGLMALNCTLSWVQVRALNVGDLVCCENEYGLGLTRLMTHEVLPLQDPVKMYNLTVLDDSSYVANDIVAHNCGYIVAPGKVDEWLPTSMEKNNETGEKGLTSQVNMTEAETLGLLKMDFLGLKNMTAIHDTINFIKETRGIDIDYHDIPLGDRETYEMLAKGMTGGVFQLEQPGMTNVIVQMLAHLDEIPDDKLEVEGFEKVGAAVALYRPGPMAYIPEYVRGVEHPESVHYDCPEEEDILKSTYGVIVYQEQVLFIAQRLAGYSLGKADILRRAMGKKKKDVMAKEKVTFISGCVERGINNSVAETIWNKIEKFAEYAFNRSHSVCYAFIAMITAYMACHWGPEFYSAMLNAFLSDSKKLRIYLGQTRQRHIKVLPPDINHSKSGFYPVNDHTIRFGLQGINGVSAIAPYIEEEREAHGKFTSLQDFCKRMGDAGHMPSKGCLTSLIAAGCFSSYSKNKKALLNQMEQVLDYLSWSRKNVLPEQVNLFGQADPEIPLPNNIQTTQEESVELEKKYTGMYITGHPADLIYPFLTKDKSLCHIIDLPEKNGCTVSVVGVIQDPQPRYTKKGEMMYNFTLSDQFGDIPCVIFPKRLEANRHRIVAGALVKVIARYQEDENYGNKLLVEDILSKQEIIQRTRSAIIVTIENKAQQEELMRYVGEHPGPTKVQVRYQGKTYKPKNLSISLGLEEVDYLRSRFPGMIAA